MSVTKVFYQAESPQQCFGIEKLKLQLTIRQVNSPDEADILILTSREQFERLKLANEFSQLRPEGFMLKKLSGKIAILSADQTGAMYGIQDVAEQLQMSKSIALLTEKKINPKLQFRGIKFNLPWNSYRTDESLQLHEATLKDLKYWEKFLDMMAENHFNAMTLWNLHPFSYMIRAKNFPDACPYSDLELQTWQVFWHGLFKMAAERGIKTYVFNWNIMVSDAFAKKYKLAEYCLESYPGKSYIGKGDYSPVIQKYTQESIRQLLAEYPELTGIGASQNERMEGVEEQVWQNWIVDTYFDEIKNAGRPVEFIIRAHTHPAPELTRKAVEENASKLGTVYMDVKFNWSHSHATPDLMYIHGGSRSKSLWEPAPKNYKMVYTMRNEDFFVLRWGEPDFIREVIKRNSQEYVGGYLIGSEAYIPAKEYTTKPGKWLTWKYAFEKQWLYYQVWGRLMHDPETKDDVFANSFNQKYDISTGIKLIEAHKLAGKMPLKLASFYAASWDFTLYSEGFLANAPSGLKCLYDSVSPFISVNEIIGTVTLDSNLVSIQNFVSGNYSGSTRTTPLQLAAELIKNGEKALKILQEIKTTNPTLVHEMDDVKTWSYLSLYFGEKLKGGTALQQFRTTGEVQKQEESIKYLESALGYWEEIVHITGKYMDDISLVHLNKRYVNSLNSRPLSRFSWANLLDEVKNDIQIAKTSRPMDVSEKNSLVIVEMESAKDLKGWSAGEIQYNGNNIKYLTWNGEDYFNSPGHALLEYKIKIIHPGTYRFIWHTKVGKGESKTEHNDTWLRIPDASDFYGEKEGKIIHPKGVCTEDCPNGAGSDGWFKIYSSGTTDWTWSTRTSDKDAHHIYTRFEKSGIYTVQISARSTGHLLNRFVIYRESEYSEKEATALNLTESKKSRMNKENEELLKSKYE